MRHDLDGLLMIIITIIIGIFFEQCRIARVDVPQLRLYRRTAHRHPLLVLSRREASSSS